MNLYGDWGNTLVLKKRLQWRDYPVKIIDHNPGDSTDFSEGDIFIGGGGQDSGQNVIQEDLLRRAAELKKLAEDGVPMLMICGMYQLFGKFFVTNSGERIIGAGILPIETRAGDERMIGNITLESKEFGGIVGYENHSGQTFLDENVLPLGRVVRGAGNSDNGYEGVRRGRQPSPPAPPVRSVDRQARAHDPPRRRVDRRRGHGRPHLDVRPGHDDQRPGQHRRLRE